MTRRLSIISLAGMARTEVAVGMLSEADMFLTTAAAAPRRTFFSSSAGAGLGPPETGAAFEAGAGVVCGARGVAAFEEAAFAVDDEAAGLGAVWGAGAGSAFAAGPAFAAGAGFAGAGAAACCAVAVPGGAAAVRPLSLASELASGV